MQKLSVEDLKSMKRSWKNWLNIANTCLRRVQNIHETKENRWDIKQLEETYNFYVSKIKHIIKSYSILINSKDEELNSGEELSTNQYFKIIKDIEDTIKEIKKEYNKKSFRKLNNDYIHGFREAEVIRN